MNIDTNGISVSDVAVVGKFSTEDVRTKFENLSWKMQLPAAAILEDESQKDGISVYSSVSIVVLFPLILVMIRLRL